MTDLPVAPDGVPTFDSYDAEPSPTRPFRLTGRRLMPAVPDDPDSEAIETADRWSEDFLILGDAPAGALSTLANAVTIKDGVIHYTANAVVRFLRSVIVPADEQRFDDLVNDKYRVIRLEQLGDVMMWAAGIVAQRPTGPLSSSTTGQRGTEPGSGDGGSLPVTDPEPSTI